MRTSKFVVGVGVMSLLMVACDGFFGPLDLELEPGVTGPNNTTTSANNTSTGANNTSTGANNTSTGPNNTTTSANNTTPETSWDSTACINGVTACPSANHVCLDGTCGEILALDAGAQVFCAVHESNAATRVFCWGPGTEIVNPNGGDEPYAFVPGLIGDEEYFHDIAVGQSTACVLVSFVSPDDPLPPNASQMTLRCWGTDPLNPGNTDYSPRSSSINLLVQNDTDPKLTISESNFCLSGNFLPSFPLTREGVCWGRFESGAALGLGDRTAPEDVTVEVLERLGDPGIVTNSRSAVCYTDEGQASVDVRCNGSVEDILDERVGIGEVDAVGGLAMGPRTVCGVFGGRIQCEGATNDYRSSFPDDGSRSYRNIRVGFSDLDLCALTREVDTPLVDCLFESDGLKSFEMVANEYDLTSVGMCGVDTTNLSQLRCHGLGTYWPGLTVTPR